MDPSDYNFQPDLSRASTIPARWYTDPQMYAGEQNRVFGRTWQAAGLAAWVSIPGDYFACEIAGEPVLVTRTADGALRAFSNICRHRGSELCKGRGSGSVVKCPYHGWTYDLSGELLGVPYPGGYTSFDKRTRGLTRVPRVASYRGFVFASFSETGIALAEHLGAATKLIDRSCDLSPEGRISPVDTGIWNDEQREAWSRIVDFVHGQGATAGMQLAHAGRKASTTRTWEGSKPIAPQDGGWVPVAPSPIPFHPGAVDPHALSTTEIADIASQFATTARMAREAGMASALVLTGATPASALVDAPIQPDYVLGGVAEVLPDD